MYWSLWLTPRAQSMAKWAARFALGLSNSVPGIRIEKKNYKRIQDISKRVESYF